MVQELKSLGVKRVDGDVVVDQRFYDDHTTPPGFEQQPGEWATFRAPVSAVALDENTVTLTVHPSSVGNPAHIEMTPPGFVDLDGTIKTAEGSGADTVELALSGNGSRMSAHVSGAVAGDSRVVRFTRRAEDPRLLGGYALKALLEKADVKVSGEVKLGTARGHTLAKHLSAPLSQLLYALGKQSDNFYAEMVFRTLGGEARAHPARSLDASDVVTKLLSSIGAMDPGVVIKNGSGLFDSNRVTAWSTVQLLRWAWRDPAIQPEYAAQLSVRGRRRYAPQALPPVAHAPQSSREDGDARRRRRALGLLRARRRPGAARVLRSLQPQWAASRTAPATPPIGSSSSSPRPPGDASDVSW